MPAPGARLTQTIALAVRGLDRVHEHYLTAALAGALLVWATSLSAVAGSVDYTHLAPQLVDCSSGAIPCLGEDPPQDESNVIRVLQTEDENGNLRCSQIETNSNWDGWVWFGTKIDTQCSLLYTDLW
jgi:hypothetical protein